MQKVPEDYARDLSPACFPAFFGRDHKEISPTCVVVMKSRTPNLKVHATPGAVSKDVYCGNIKQENGTLTASARAGDRRIHAEQQAVVQLKAETPNRQAWSIILMGAGCYLRHAPRPY